MKAQAESTLRNACPSRDVLIGYSWGTLNPNHILRVAAHVEECGQCLDTLEQLDNCSDSLLIDLARQQWHDSAAEDDEDEMISTLQGLLAPPVAKWESGDQHLSPSRRVQPQQVGPYEILEPLGEGGMGAVYKARHIHLGKIVALKLLSPDKLTDPAAVALFVQEMKAVGQLCHPNIVQAHDAGVEGTPYLAMEMLDGIDLSRLVKKIGPLRSPDACHCIQQAARGLQHAFTFGLVHRDVKPSNLLLTCQGEVKLLDLGLACLEGGPSRQDTGAVAPGAVMGTLDYIAPEQLRNSGAVDIRADFYSLGCTLYFLLSGRPPFPSVDHSRRGKQQAHLFTMPPDIRKERPGVPDGLWSILERLLSKDPSFRFAAPKDLERALEPFAKGANLPILLTGDNASASRVAPAAMYPCPAQPGIFTHLKLWLLCLLVFSGVVALGIAFLAHTAPGAQETDPITTGGDTDRLRIETFEVDCGRKEGGGTIWQNPVGNKAGACSVQNVIRVRGKLSTKAHCYLLVIQPGGQELICSLEREAGSTHPRETVLYPPVGELRVASPGNYVCILLAGRHSMPEYERWKASTGTWTEKTPTDVGFWRFDGTKTFQLGGLPAPHVNAFLTQLCHFLSARPGVDVVQAVAFSVVADRPPG